MILNQSIIADLKEKSGLRFDQTKDVESLGALIFKATGRNIGTTTLKRLLGLINDERKSNEYTLNTIALYLGFPSWKEYSATKNLDSVWGFVEDAVIVEELEAGSKVQIHYLNRIVDFEVKIIDGVKVLQVLEAKNSSLQAADLLYVHKITKGTSLIADKVVRGSEIGNYKTNGEITFVNVCE